MQKQICRICKSEKNLNEFEKSKDYDSGYTRRCKTCTNNVKYIYRNENLDRVRKQARDSAKRNYLISGKSRNLMYKYGITLDDYNRILKEQNYTCKTCFSTTKLVVDHCHISNKVRGILCDDCNLALGKIKDNVHTLQAMIIYLSN